MTVARYRADLMISLLPLYYSSVRLLRRLAGAARSKMQCPDHALSSHPFPVGQNNKSNLFGASAEDKTRVLQWASFANSDLIGALGSW